MKSSFFHDESQRNDGFSYQNDAENLLLIPEDYSEDPYSKASDVKGSIFVDSNLSPNYRYGFLILFVILFTVVTLVVFDNTPSRILVNNEEIYAAYEGSFTVSSSNEYGTLTSDVLPYPFLEDSLFAETYKTNKLSVNNYSLPSGCIYHYYISGNDGYEVEEYSYFDYYNFRPTTPGEYQLSINIICDEVVVNTHTQTIWSKYIRRELSTLTDDDREIFLDAMSTLWKVSTKEGKELYGEAYKSLNYFAAIHNDAGGSPVCDEFHGSVGFFNNHVMLGAYLEQSLQLVDPRTSLHYMAYYYYYSLPELDSHNANQLDGGAWTELMTDKWFGSNDPITGRIIDGRWVNITVPYLDDDFYEDEEVSTSASFFPDESSSWSRTLNLPHLYSPYGYLRSPWNYNPSPYVTRFNNVNGISNISAAASIIKDYYRGVDVIDYLGLLNEVYQQPASSFLTYAEDQSHGNIHFTIAGAGGDYSNQVNSYLQSTYEFTDEDLLICAKASQTFFKLWITRSIAGGSKALVSCENNPYVDGVMTSMILPGEEGGPSCSCKSDYFVDEDSLNTLIMSYLSTFESTSLYTKLLSLSFDSKVDIMQNLCGRFQIEGDMASSGAALDPLFWVAHGALDKVFQYQVFTSWLSDLVFPSADGACSGHSYNGTKYWLTGYSFQDKSIDVASLTNHELMSYLNPSTTLFRDNVNFLFNHTDMKALFASAAGCSKHSCNFYNPLTSS